MYIYQIWSLLVNQFWWYCIHKLMLDRHTDAPGSIPLAYLNHAARNWSRSRTVIKKLLFAEIDQWATSNTGVMIDGAVTQFGLKVMGWVVLPNNKTGCYSMLDYHYQVMSNEQNGTNQMSFWNTVHTISTFWSWLSISLVQCKNQMIDPLISRNGITRDFNA